ncbi:pyridoxamine 5'-phosphate oxidase [Nocardioides sp. zg-579]|uniref:Pyridoxine/pyridoxamine 5'-phosphate oxidase n=1 Tax=Nocardioides marmotae TaxID=2663857 RepID=A0A6I3J4F2_9ACTN|nr:pyridoxamine 5'-phosphate oxidase [Gordonia jinghuaiqii]MTB84207.1 pyridoxamine 5'-phosphate oxidase [Nocardioides marmotae]MTB93844.1 pyridoxamine 5'-phosphate oxidase [Nocardioides marmotae]QKE03315.1 pyridoxamine 5'-phosphate oxidase [Nocardioides marmotae]
MRREYAAAGLAEDDLAPDPLTMFRRWFAEVEDAVHEPNAMVLSTVSTEGRPASRMVLLKELDERGFVFFTNTASRKGVELAADPLCALLFPWHPLERQVRVDGVAEPLSREAVADYFAVRPRGSQLGAWASHQSRPVAGREELAAAYDEVERRFADVPDADLPVPEEWGGYVVRPEAVEFWQGRPGRMHDRLLYTRSGDGWTTQRLAP